MPVLNLKDRKVERSFTEKIRYGIRTAYDWTSEKVRNTVEYVKEDPQRAIAILAGVTAAAGGARKLVSSANRHRALRQEKFHREREVYDPSSKVYLVTKRKLRKDDVDRINRLRREKGYKMSEALSELNLLKR